MHAFYIPRSQPHRVTVNARCLDGIDAESDVSAGYSDPAITKEYQEFERRRGYQLDNKHAH